MGANQYEPSFHAHGADETTSGVAAAVVAGIELAGPQPLADIDGERFFTQIVPAGAKLETFDLEELEEKLAPTPRRKKGTVHVQDADSFIAYLEKHGLPQSEVYADLARMSLVGVINAHQEAVYDEARESGAGHGDHRVQLELVQTDAWKAWVGKDKTAMRQQEFAEFLEDRANDVTDPDAATMLEIAQSLFATTGVDFKSAHRLSDGQVAFRYEETTNARAGHTGELEIPSRFAIAIAPFEGCPPVELIARFRYRTGPQGLTLFYALLNPADVAREAFEAYVDTVDESVKQPVFKGRPE
ncbi:MAG: DUF2303 family protein [Hamadaea sp.]|nr:DUF2303 family protein [Hamadaea sp.]